MIYFGEVVLDQKQGSYLTLRYPVALDDLLPPPYAVYEDRRGLNQLNSNSITITSEEKLQEYEELIGILKKINKAH